MLNLLNAIDARGSMFWLLVILGILLIVEVAVFAILLIRNKHKDPEEKPRQPVGIILNTEVVRREYKVGENFDASGLIVTARYSDDPFEVTVDEYTIVTPELINKLASEGKKPEDLMGCRIYAPDLSVVGKPTVTVAFLNQTAAYAINVVEPTTEFAPVAPKAVVEEAVETVDYTVTVVAPEELKALQVALFNGKMQIGSAVNVVDGKATVKAPAGDYTVKVFGLPDDDYEIDAELLSATKLFATVTVAYSEEAETEAPVTETVVVEPVEEEHVGYEVTVVAPEELNALQVALFNGKTQVGSAVNVVDGKATIEAPAGDYAVKVFGLPDDDYEIKAELLSATKLSATIVINYSEERAEQEEITVETVEEVIEETVPTVSEVIEETEPAQQEEVVAETAVAEAEQVEPLVIEEESFEGGILRYDRSFTARIIQTENEVKGWYTDIKNELLSYKKVHDRMSWKRESYNLGRQPFAKMAFRGETLCLYLPLDPESLADSKYKVENVSDNASYKDTPCLYRIKNNKRARYAVELIAMTAELLQTPRIEREEQDYFLPYEGIVELIKKGLVKRNIKSVAEEQFFASNKTENN